MAAWAGFSDEELRRMHMKDQPVSLSGHGRGRKPTPTNRSRQQLQREKALKRVTEMPDNKTLQPEQRLVKPQVLTPRDQAPTTKAREEDQVAVKVEAVNNHEPKTYTGASPVAKELDKQEVELREKTRLEKLQQEQRVMEERNKQRKALLAKTIAEKSKQTQAEAVKLKRIQKELQALDDSVSNDISILRGLIEQASLDYTAAWKRFERAEAEYVAAKLSLHQRTDAKEQLTEHLCAIIQQNELRKAAKLEELMLQLELNSTPENQQDLAQTKPPKQDQGSAPSGENQTSTPQAQDLSPPQNPTPASAVDSSFPIAPTSTPTSSSMSDIPRREMVVALDPIETSPATVGDKPPPTLVTPETAVTPGHSQATPS